MHRKPVPSSSSEHNANTRQVSTESPRNGSPNARDRRPSSRSRRTGRFHPLEIPSVKPEVSSGFPYKQRLFELQVSPEEWDLFNDDLVKALQLTTPQKIAAWSVGITVGTVTALGLLVLAVAPGYYAGKAVKDKSVAKKVKLGMLDEGDLFSVMSNWNAAFAGRGFRVQLVLPKLKDKDGKSKTDDSQPKDSESEKSSLSGGKVSRRQKKQVQKEVKKMEEHYRLIIEDTSHGSSIEASSPAEPAESGTDVETELPCYSPHQVPPYLSTSGYPTELDATESSRPIADRHSRGNIHELEG